MATDQWVDDEYYVGEDGAMLINTWKKTLADEDMDDPEDDGESWYYFGSKGKKTVSGDKKINGKHISSMRTAKCRMAGMSRMATFIT